MRRADTSGGHSSIIGGCVVRREALAPVHRAIHKNVSGTVNAFEAWLVLRGGESAVRQFLDRVRLVMHAVSHGGMEMLATLPTRSSHRGMKP